jgi:hypothetical protein
MSKLTLVKGQSIKVTGNSIFEMMGYSEVTGTVFLVYPDGSIALKCRETNAMEKVDLDDGTVEAA